MKTGTLVPLAEYLTTSYRPDCDYVEGRTVDRNVGERDHSILQRELIRHLLGQREIHVFPEQRVQVRADRFRVPDICATEDDPREPIFTRPPFLCIEILSKDDRMSEMQEKIDDYLTCGVRYVWLLDPRRRRAWVHTVGGITEATDVLRTDNPTIAISLSELFSAL